MAPIAGNSAKARPPRGREDTISHCFPKRIFSRSSNNETAGYAKEVRASIAKKMLHDRPSNRLQKMPRLCNG